MGKLRFSKIVKFFALALLSTATAIAVVAVLSSPATAKGGGGGDSDDYPWDTDNLKIGSTYSARSFAVPHYGNQGDPARTGTRTSGLLTLTENHSPCQPSVMDGFFQNSASQPRNDLPKLEKTAATENKWKETPGHICDVFVTAQNLAISRYSANGGFWLDSEGSLRKGGFGGWMTATRDATASLGYTTWDQKGSLYSISGYSVPGGGVVYYTRAQAPSATDDGYVARVDAGRTVGVGIPSGELTLPNPAARKGSITQNAGVKTFSTKHISHHNGTIHLPQDKSVGGHAGSWCPAKSHPRGEDAYNKIGGGTGRTLSSLTDRAKIRLADLFWCRSDVRYPIWYAPQSVAGTTCGTAGARSCPSGVTIPTEDFRAWGRVNCYYTALEITSSGKCVYPHPVPQCTDNGTKRNFTATELGGYMTGAAFTAADDGSTDCADSTPADPPQQAGFTADACVTASLEIYENRIAGSDAEPGVAASDRTLVVASGRTAWDLDVTSPHPLTASAPRDTTAGSGDPDGCADGSESRADHASSPAGAARKQSPAPSYAASDRTDTAAPPNDADGDIDYTAAVKNMAHRYASRVAENTCAAKLAEAEAELSLLELREDGFAQWLSDYKTAADTNASRYSSYRRTPQQSGSGLAILRFNDYEANKATYAALLATRYTALSSALSAAKTAYDTTTDRTAGSSRAAVISSGNSGCAAHYDREITRLKNLFAAAETSALGNGASGIKEERTAVTGTRLSSPPAVAVTTTVNAYTVPDISAIQTRPYRAAYCSSGRWFLGVPGTSCVIVRDCRPGEPLFGCSDPGTIVPAQQALYRCPGERYTVSGTVSGTYKTSTRSRAFSATYEAPARGNSTSSSCPSFAVQSGATYASDAEAYVRGTPGTTSSLPSVASTTAPATLRVLNKVSLLGSYYSSHADRTNLEAVSADDRNTAGGSLSVSVGSVPSGSPQKIEDYQTAYKTAYDTAFSQAEGHMSGTAWNSFDWRYQTSTLAWGNYQEDPATTYSASIATPRDGTGCDLIAVASDGSVSVEATRLDYETSSYGKSSVYSTRTDAQRTCKIRRTRTPQLNLEYQPSVPSGTDTTKTATFWNVNYQPTTAAERFKLYDEAEVFAVKASLADRAPVLCYQPGEALVAHVAAKGIDAVNKAVFRHASGFAGGNKKHCYRHPSVTQPAFAFFDDTAHSAMASVNAVWQQPSTKIVSKLGSTDDLKMMANTVNLVASAPVAYDDATRTSSFYGTYYTFPTGSSTESPSGWNITGHPTLTLASTFTQHQVQAKDTAAKTPTTHTMVFKFIDCVFGIEDVAFVDNIASPYALLSDENGVVPSGWKQTYDSDPHNSSTWYYPALSTYEGALRLDGRRDSNGDPITYGRNTQGGFAHPSYDLENTAADGIGWGIVYEDKVGKQQPVWAVYAPPVPGDNTQLAIEVCGANNLGTGGKNPMPTATRRIGTPATPPPASGVWEWKTSGWDYHDSPVMLWSVDDDPDRDDPWRTRTSDSSLVLPRKPYNNMEYTKEDSDVGALYMFKTQMLLINFYSF